MQQTRRSPTARQPMVSKHAFLFLLSLAFVAAAAQPQPPAAGTPADDSRLFCAVMNPTTGTYIDLSQLSATPNSPRDGGRTSRSRWLVPSWGCHTNFTLGVCSSPITDDDRELANTTGAYYVDPATGREVSIGDFSTRPRLSPARKLTLQYDHGDVCPNGVDRKSTLLSFVCDRDLAARAQISFVGSLHDCAYFFEVRSVHACPTSARSNEVNVLGIFIGIFVVFFVVEFGGRRWLYGKVRTHFQAPDARRPPAWRRVLGRVTPVWRGGRAREVSQDAFLGDAFLGDMRRQNAVLDALDVASDGSSENV